MMPSLHTVVIADDHVMFRNALSRMIDAEPEFSVVGEAGDASEGVSLVLEHSADIFVTDIQMPGVGVFSGAETILQQSPSTRIIFLSGWMLDRYIEQVLALPHASYLVKTDGIESLISALRAVMNGERYLSPSVRSRVTVDDESLRRPAITEPKTTRSAALTPREREVLHYIASGLSKKEIAATIHLSVKTIDNHASNIMNKLDIHDRVLLTRYALREGLVHL